MVSGAWDIVSGRTGHGALGHGAHGTWSLTFVITYAPVEGADRRLSRAESLFCRGSLPTWRCSSSAGPAGPKLGAADFDILPWLCLCHGLWSMPMPMAGPGPGGCAILDINKWPLTIGAVV